jgi:hypothetical protein
MESFSNYDEAKQILEKLLNHHDCKNIGMLKHADQRFWIIT